MWVKTDLIGMSNFVSLNFELFNFSNLIFIKFSEYSSLKANLSALLLKGFLLCPLTLIKYRVIFLFSVVSIIAKSKFRFL